MIGRRSALAVCACTASMDAQGAFIIDSRSFFDNIPHTLIDFETRGDGSPVIIVQPLGGLVIPADEYAAQGFVFDERLGVWADMRPPSCVLSCGVGDALLEVGSHSTTLSGGPSGRGIIFTTEVRAFSFGAVESEWLTNPAMQEFAPTIIAFDAKGAEIGRVTLWSDLIDGGFHDWDGVVPRIAYGEIGLASATPIARLEIATNTGLAFFDDFRFSSVPAPGAAPALLGAVCAAGARRKR